jgi:hypothetical protein
MKGRVEEKKLYVWGKKKKGKEQNVMHLTEVGFEPTPEDWCLKPAP